MKRYVATYNIPDSIDGSPLQGTLCLYRKSKLTPAIVAKRVAKAYRLAPEQVTEIQITVSQ